MVFLAVFSALCLIGTLFLARALRTHYEIRITIIPREKSSVTLVVPSLMSEESLHAFDREANEEIEELAASAPEPVVIPDIPVDAPPVKHRRARNNVPPTIE